MGPNRPTREIPPTKMHQRPPIPAPSTAASTRSMTRGRGLLRQGLPMLLAAWGLTLPLVGQSSINPDDALAIWDFNTVTQATQAFDLMQDTPMQFQAATAFSADGGGRSGAVGDRAVNFGTTAGNSARITDPAFMGLLNQSNLQQDQLTVVFWQKWSTAIAASSSVWFSSANATGGNRGFQVHLPYSDNTVYFDTSGCCASPAERLNAAITSVFPSFNWQQWHHFALVKNGGAKQIWVDGQLFLSQSSGPSALLRHWTDVLPGQQPGPPEPAGAPSSEAIQVLTTTAAQYGIEFLGPPLH